MKRVPHAHGVNRALRSVRVATRKSLKTLNQVAGRMMAKGDYSAAETLAAKGKDLREFLTEVDALQKRWRHVSGSGPRVSKKAVTPLWSYYQPILRALVESGGESRRTDLEERVGFQMGSVLLPDDHEPLARGKERWQVMVQRARRPMVAEGWIEKKMGKVWRITDSGRRAAGRSIADDAIRGRAKPTKRQRD